MKKKFRTLIVGATALACGYALTHDDTLILERGINPGAEFTLALDKPFISAPTTEAGERLWEETGRRGMRRENALHLPPVSDLLAFLLREKACAVFLFCEFVRTERVGDGWKTTIFSRDGFSEIYSERFINSYIDAETSVPDAEKRICGTVVSLEGSDMPSDGAGISFIRGALEEEITAVVTLSHDDDMSRAREKLHGAWKSFRESGEHRFSLATEAGALGLLYREPVVRPDENLALSASFGDIMKAFEGGVKIER